MQKQHYNLAFVFPGQGSQSVGMLTDVAQTRPIVRQVFERASAVLDKDLWRIMAEGPETLLNQTENTQPVMLAAGVALWEAWCEASPVRPSWMAGHSLGEYTALVCAGVLTFEDALKLVAERARLMQQAVPEGVGAMAAILGLADHEVVKLCHERAQHEIVEPANFNSPGQVVVAGHTAAVDRVIEAAKTAGAKCAIKLAVSVPSHCRLMENAAQQLHQALQTVPFEMPQMTIIHNADVAAHSAPEVMRHALKEQLYKPVRWSDSIKFMYEQGVMLFVECGPGKVLLGLNKRIAKEGEHLAIYDEASLQATMERFQ